MYRDLTVYDFHQKLKELIDDLVDFNIVKTHMIHGPYNELNQNSLYMKNDSCTKILTWLFDYIFIILLLVF